MKVADLSQDMLEAIKPLRWDRIIEKHEGPYDWDSVFRYYNPEFISIDGHPVLLPIEAERHSNITILRTIWSADGLSLTLFLKDTTYDDESFSAGYMAVCDRVAGADFFLAVLYHEWFIIQPSPLLAPQALLDFPGL
jgi:hypothetical protein